DKWSAYSQPLSGIEVTTPQEGTIERIDELAYRVKSNGATPDNLGRLRDVIREFAPGSTVLFALTEISQLLALRKPGHKDKVEVVDTMQIYAESIARQYVGYS